MCGLVGKFDLNFRLGVTNLRFVNEGGHKNGSCIYFGFITKRNESVCGRMSKIGLPTEMRLPKESIFMLQLNKESKVGD